MKNKVVKKDLKPLLLLSCLSDVNIEISYKPKNETAETEEELIG